MPKFFIKVLNQNVFLFYNSNPPRRKIIWNYFSPCCVPDFFQRMLLFFILLPKMKKGEGNNNSDRVDIFKIIFVFLNIRRYSCINYKTISPAFQVKLSPLFSFCLTPPHLPSDFMCLSTRLLILFLLESHSRNQTHWIFTFYISTALLPQENLTHPKGEKIWFHATFPVVETIHPLHLCPLAKGPAQHSAP